MQRHGRGQDTEPVVRNMPQCFVMPPQRTSVVVTHDNFVIRTGLARTLAGCEDMAVQTHEPGHAAVPDCDVVVADLDSGVRVLILARELPIGMRRPRIVIVTGSEQEWQIRQALGLGAGAYLLLDTTAEELVSAVRGASRGGCHLSDRVSATLVQNLAIESLTARQEDVLALLSAGLCNKHIAQRLGVSVGTVKTHLRSAYGRLQVHSRTEAIAAAARRGILPRASPRAEAGLSNAISAASMQTSVLSATRH
jgi:DNA-binding NarL/FixJ family response regulator